MRIEKILHHTVGTITTTLQFHANVNDGHGYSQCLPFKDDRSVYCRNARQVIDFLIVYSLATPSDPAWHSWLPECEFVINEFSAIVSLPSL